MSFCLLPDQANKFIEALKNGNIDPAKLADMTSAERHDFFSKIVGEQDAHEVNALFESKLLLKNQQAGLIRWAKNVSGITEQARRDIVTRVENMSKVLDPASEKVFLSDLAEKKLGTQVTIDEAHNITQLSGKAQAAREVLKTDPYNKAKQVEYGNKFLDLTEYLDSLKPANSSKLDFIINLLNLPKSALTSVLHFSASFVQGWGMMTTRPFWEAFGNQFKYFADPQAYRDLQAGIIGHPDYPLAMDGKLGITKLGDKLSLREEAIQSSLLEHVPGLKNLVKASSRGFTGFLNYTRFYRFTTLLDAARLAGEDVRKGSSVVRDIAKTVNDFTGRGAIGKDDRYASVTPALNAAFFSPRKISATIQMFNPERYLNPKISPTARMAALRQLSGSLIATSAVLSLASLAGAKVETDPTNTNFAKIKIGNTTLDMTGGNEAYVRLLARLTEGKSVSGTGRVTDLTSGKFGGATRADLAINFFRGKLAPTASALADFMYGKDPVGNPFNVGSELYNKLTPIVMQDFINLALNDSGNSAAWVASLAGIFGVGIQSNKK